MGSLELLVLVRVLSGRAQGFLGAGPQTCRGTLSAFWEQSAEMSLVFGQALREGNPGR